MGHIAALDKAQRAMHASLSAKCAEDEKRRDAARRKLEQDLKRVTRDESNMVICEAYPDARKGRRTSSATSLSACASQMLGAASRRS